MLDATVSASTGVAGSGAVEGRQSKSAMVGMLTQLAGGGPGAERTGDEVGFNPQPDPPGDEAGIIINGGPTGAVDTGDEAGIIIIGGQPGEDVGFNPQPDPPIAKGRVR